VVALQPGLKNRVYTKREICVTILFKLAHLQLPGIYYVLFHSWIMFRCSMNTFLLDDSALTEWSGCKKRTILL